MAASGCSDACRNDVVAIAPSPGGKHQVAMFSRDCGATTGRSTQISVLGAAEAPSGSGNAFVADGGTTPTAWGGPWAEMAWLAPDRLQIRYDSRARLFKKADRVGDVSVSYQPVTR
jgi:hypothetical protein